VAETAGLERPLMPVPFPAWQAIAWLSEKLPKPPLTRNQVELMQIDNLAAPAAPGFAELGISPQAVEETVRQIIAAGRSGGRAGGPGPVARRRRPSRPPRRFGGKRPEPRRRSPGSPGEGGGGRPSQEAAMRVGDCMTRDVRIAGPDETIRQAALAMAECDAGILPVGENDRLVGMVTDRDIAVRGVAEGRGPDAKVRDVMSAEVKYCFEDDPVEEVLHNMAELQIRRLPVVNREKRLVGIISLGDLATNGETTASGQALGGIARPGGQHSQTTH
jgi:CBS domain-containing protein